MKKITLLLAAILCMTTYSYSASRYWVGTGSNKNWNTTVNWSASTGGASGASVPGSADDVTFDGGGTGQCSINATVSINSLTISSLYTDTIKQNANAISINTGGMTLNGGTFWGGSTAITNSGVFTLAGCNFKSTSGTLTIKGNFAFSSGSFTHNSGNVLFTGNLSITAPASTHTNFYDLQFSGGIATTINIDSTASDTINVTHKFLQNGGTLVKINGGNLNIQGDIYQTNNYAAGGGTGTLNINGTGSQTFYGQSNPTYAGTGYFCNVTINKSSGTLYLKDYIDLGGTWNHINGSVDVTTYSNTVYFWASGTHYITGNAQTFSNISLSTYGGAPNVLNIGSGDTITVSGTLSLQANGKIQINTGIIKLTGNMAITNTYIGPTTGTGTLWIAGTGTQTITNTGSSLAQASLCSIIIDKPSGTLTLPNTLNVDGNWRFVQGTIDATTYTSTVVFCYPTGGRTISGSHTLNNVTFYANNGSTNTINSGDILTVAGNLRISGTNSMIINTGTIKAMGDITVDNTFTSSGGGTATINIAGTGNQTLTGSGTAGAGRLCNVTVNKSSDTLSLVNSISIAGAWTYTQGNIKSGSSTLVSCGSSSISCEGTSTNMSFNNFTAVASSTTTLTGKLFATGKIFLQGNLNGNSKNIYLGGDWDNTGTFTYANTEVTFNGAGYQQIIKSGTVNFYKLTINKSGGNVNLDAPTIVSNTLTLTNGSIGSTSTNLLSLPDNATVTGGSDNSYVYGPFKKTGNDAFTFPLGDTLLASGAYHPLAITAPATTSDVFTAQYYAQNQTDGSTIDTTMLTSISAVEYWNLTHTTGSSTTSVTLGWNRNSGMISAPDSHLALWDSGTSKWKDKGGVSYTGTNTVGTTTSSSALSTFGHFTLGIPKAVTYYFRSKQNGNWENTGTWQTSPDSTTWSSATVTPNYKSRNINIITGDTVTITQSVKTDQTLVNGVLIYGDYANDTLTINDGTGTDLTINGTFQDIGPKDIVWLGSSSWVMGSSGTLLRTRATADNWSGTYSGGISTIPATATWLVRKTGTDNPLITSSSFYPNLTIENTSGSSWTTGSASSFTGSATPPVIKGNLNIGGSGTSAVSFLNDNSNTTPVLVTGNLTLQSGSTLRSYGTGFEIQGDLALNGTMDYGTGNATFNFTGSNNQNISTTATLTFQNLQLNKTNTTRTVTLQNPATISGTATFTNGYLITTSTNIPSFDAASAVSGASDSSFVNGPILKIGNSAFTFPTGKNNEYQPISISAPSSSSAAYTAEYFHSNPSLGTAKDSTIDSVSTCEYWNLNNVGTVYPVSVTAGWNSNSCYVTPIVGDMRLTEWDGSKWANLGNSASTSGIVTSASAVSSFGSFTTTQKAGHCITARNFLPQIAPLFALEKQTSGTDWYKFTAEGDSLDIKIFEVFSNINTKLYSAKLWGGRCDSLHLVAIDSISSLNDSVFVISTTLITAGNEYYIQINKNNTNVDTLKFVALFNYRHSQSNCLPCAGPSLVSTCDLICNGNFEINPSLTCQTNAGDGGDKACPWNTANGGSPDYYNSICPVGTYGVPSNYVGNEPAQSGNAYVGINLYFNPAPAIHEYIYEPLRATLRPSVIYTLTFYVALAPNSKFNVPNIDAVFCSTDPMPSNSSVLGTPNLTSAETYTFPLHNIFFTGVNDVQGQWKQMTVTFTATGLENYIVIGNYIPTTHGTTTSGLPIQPGAYYYIDNVSLIQQTNAISANAVSNSVICGYNTTLTASGGSSYTWTPSTGLSSTTGITVSATPATTTTYTVTNNDNTYGCTESATVNVTVNPLSIQISGIPSACATSATYSVSTSVPLPSGVTYSWSANNGASNASSTSATFTPVFTAAGGTITCTITTTNGCTATASLSVFPCCTNGPDNINLGVWGTTIDGSTLGSHLDASSEIFPGGIPTLNYGLGSPSGTWIIGTGGEYEIGNQSLAINGTFTVDHDLYFDVCDITLGENAKINVISGHKLVINESHLYGCTSMWDGIYANSSNTMVIDNSLIEDAKSAVNSIGGAQYILNNSVFNKNYKSLVVSQYSGPVTTATVKSCVFTCRNFSSINTIGPIFSDYSSHGNTSTYSTATLKPAFPAYLPGTTKSYTGIEISNFQNTSPLQIGETSGTGDLNIFDYLDYGIRLLYSSNVVVKNNLFENIIDLTPQVACRYNYYCPHNQSGIFGNGTYSHYTCSLTVGGAGNYEANSFIRCTNGVLSSAFNHTILNNTFNTIYNAGIDIELETSLTSFIDNNQFDNVQNGIISNALGRTTNTTISNNKINRNGGTGVIRTANGIYIANPGRLLSNVIIQNNEVNYPTIGINLTNTTAGIIEDNNIYFHGQLNNSSGNIGIKVKNSGLTNTLRNVITYVPAAPAIGALYGIYMQDTPSGYEFANQMTNMGTGFYVYNNCNTSELECNIFNNCTNGFRFAPASGAQIGDQLWGTTNKSTGNYWTTSYPTTDLTGTVYNPSNISHQFNWYWDSPNPTLSNVNNINFVPASTSNDCSAPGITTTNATNRDRALINIVRGINSYDTLSAQYLLRDTVFAYQQLNENNNWLDLNTDEDNLYQNFYNAAANSNSGTFQDVNNLFINSTADSISEARTINDAITPRCTIENNQQTTNNIYLNKLAYEADTTTNGIGAQYVYDSTETVTLQTIANQNPITGGDAVYMARVMLFEEIDDNEDGSSKMHISHKNNNQQQPAKKPEFKLYPNPNDGTMTLEYNIADNESGTFTIYDLSGRIVKTQILNTNNKTTIVEAMELNAGAYFYKINEGDRTVKTDKLIIIK